MLKAIAAIVISFGFPFALYFLIEMRKRGKFNPEYTAGIKLPKPLKLYKSKTLVWILIFAVFEPFFLLFLLFSKAAWPLFLLLGAAFFFFIK